MKNRKKKMTQDQMELTMLCKKFKEVNLSFLKKDTQNDFAEVTVRISQHGWNLSPRHKGEKYEVIILRKIRIFKSGSIKQKVSVITDAFFDFKIAIALSLCAVTL